MKSNKPIKKYLVKGDFVKFCIDDDIIVSVDYGKNYVVVSDEGCDSEYLKNKLSKLLNDDDDDSLTNEKKSNEKKIGDGTWLS